MQKMALFMWERDDEKSAKALVAGRLYKEMARELAHDEMKAEICDKLEENARLVSLLKIKPLLTRSFGTIANRKTTKIYEWHA